MIIPVETEDYRAIIRSYLNALNPILRLTSKEMDVLSLMLQQYYLMYPHYTESATYLLIFSTLKRKEYHKILRISENSFNNIIVSLKKKKVLNDRGNQLSPVLVQWVKKLKDTNEVSLTYKFTREYAKQTNNQEVQV